MKAIFPSISVFFMQMGSEACNSAVTTICWLRVWSPQPERERRHVLAPHSWPSPRRQQLRPLNQGFVLRVSSGLVELGQARGVACCCGSALERSTAIDRAPASHHRWCSPARIRAEQLLVHGVHMCAGKLAICGWGLPPARAREVVRERVSEKRFLGGKNRNSFIISF